jgi:hypothetical protein
MSEPDDLIVPDSDLPEVVRRMQNDPAYQQKLKEAMQDIDRKIAEAKASGKRFMEDFIEEFNAKSGRLDAQSAKAEEYGEIVLWHRWVDNNLTEAIRGFFVPNTKGAANELLKYPGGLSSFSARVHLGRCMGMYGEITYSDLQTINRIRNGVAHPRDEASGELEVFGFNHPSIAKECEKLRFLTTSGVTKKGKWETTPRAIYQKTTWAIAVTLWSQFILPKGISDGTHPPWDINEMTP